MYEKGAGVYRDTTKAKEFRKQACQAGDKPSCEQPKPAGAST
jgi:TPR repeat protein